MVLINLRWHDMRKKASAFQQSASKPRVGESSCWFMSTPVRVDCARSMKTRLGFSPAYLLVSSTLKELWFELTVVRVVSVRNAVAELSGVSAALVLYLRRRLEAGLLIGRAD